MYIPFDNYEEFRELSEIRRGDISEELIDAARDFRESEDMEEALLAMLSDPNRTPHGPVEIVDIMTLHLSHRRKRGIAGIILKGRSFRTISPANISHQVFRLRRISGLTFAVLGHVGNLLDEAREEFVATAEDLDVDYTIIDTVDFARLAIANGILCPRDARRLVNGRCDCGCRATGGHLNFLQREALARLRDTHALGQGAGIVIMLTGSGKTRIAAIDSNTFEASRVLYVAHTHEILDGAEREFEHVYGAQAVQRGWHFDDNPGRLFISVRFRALQDRFKRSALYPTTISSLMSSTMPQPQATGDYWKALHQDSFLASPRPRFVEIVAT